MINITLIVAHDQNLCIGNSEDNQMLYHLPEDLKRFKRLTMGKPIIMGRKTYESIGKPLPGRDNIIISRSLANNPPPGTHVCQDIDHALICAQKILIQKASSQEEEKTATETKGIVRGEAMVIGGGEIYETFLPRATRILVTEVHPTEEQAVRGDVYFPEYRNTNEWEEISSKNFADNGYKGFFKEFIRI